MTNFLPKNYETPETPSNYLRLEEGKNTIRILSSAIVGYQYWTEDEEGNRKPTRVHTFEECPDDVRRSKDSRQRAKHFWAFVVYSYENKRVQILELTQKTIMRSIETLVKDENWGDPKEYNIMIGRTKTGNRDMDVEYSVMPQPKKAFKEDINYQPEDIDLEALYQNEDPFEDRAGEKLAKEVAGKI